MAEQDILLGLQRIGSSLDQLNAQTSQIRLIDLLQSKFLHEQVKTDNDKREGQLAAQTKLLKGILVAIESQASIMSGAASGAAPGDAGPRDAAGRTEDEFNADESARTSNQGIFGYLNKSLDNFFDVTADRMVEKRNPLKDTNEFKSYIKDIFGDPVFKPVPDAAAPGAGPQPAPGPTAGPQPSGSAAGAQTVIDLSNIAELHVDKMVIDSVTFNKNIAFPKGKGSKEESEKLTNAIVAALETYFGDEWECCDGQGMSGIPGMPGSKPRSKPGPSAPKAATATPKAAATPVTPKAATATPKAAAAGSAPIPVATGTSPTSTPPSAPSEDAGGLPWGAMAGAVTKAAPFIPTAIGAVDALTSVSQTNEELAAGKISDKEQVVSNSGSVGMLAGMGAAGAIGAGIGQVLIPIPGVGAAIGAAAGGWLGGAGGEWLGEKVGEIGYDMFGGKKDAPAKPKEVAKPARPDRPFAQKQAAAKVEPADQWTRVNPAELGSDVPAKPAAAAKPAKPAKPKEVAKPAEPAAVAKVSREQALSFFSLSNRILPEGLNEQLYRIPTYASSDSMSSREAYVIDKLTNERVQVSDAISNSRKFAAKSTEITLDKGQQALADKHAKTYNLSPEEAAKQTREAIAVNTRKTEAEKAKAEKATPAVQAAPIETRQSGGFVDGRTTGFTGQAAADDNGFASRYGSSLRASEFNHGAYSILNENTGKQETEAAKKSGVIGITRSYTGANELGKSETVEKNGYRYDDAEAYRRAVASMLDEEQMRLEMMREQMGVKPEARQSGGEAEASTYLVGEEGRELFVPHNGGSPYMIGTTQNSLFTPPADGTIIPNNETERLLTHPESANDVWRKWGNKRQDGGFVDGRTTGFTGRATTASLAGTGEFVNDYASRLTASEFNHGAYSYEHEDSTGKKTIETEAAKKSGVIGVTRSYMGSNALGKSESVEKFGYRYGDAEAHRRAVASMLDEEQMRLEMMKERFNHKSPEARQSPLADINRMSIDATAPSAATQPPVIITNNNITQGQNTQQIVPMKAQVRTSENAFERYKNSRFASF